MVPRAKRRPFFPPLTKETVALVLGLLAWWDARTKPDAKALANIEGTAAYAVNLEERITKAESEIKLLKARRKVLVVDTLRVAVIEKRPGFWARMWAPTKTR